MHKQAKLSPENEILNISYKRYRNFCNNLLKKIKKEYEENEFYKVKNNPKQTWNLIKTVADLGNKTTTSLCLTPFRGDPSSTVNAINEFFVNIGKCLAENIVSSSNYLSHAPSPNSNMHCNSLVLLDTDEEEIESIILDLRTECAIGYDGIPTQFIKLFRYKFIPVLVHICNLSLASGVFPSSFKVALVHPIPKAGPSGCFSDFRPISVLSTLSKILEKVINKRLSKYLETYKIIASNQYGFQTGLSTEDAVLRLTNKIVSTLDKGDKCLAIFLDLSKAFDTVSLPLLLYKLENIGVRATCLNLFRNYLTNRQQKVKIENYVSNTLQLNYGVPQGSVLGPTLFKIYINELCQLQIPHCEILCYADDTVLIITGTSWDNVNLNADVALRTVLGWLNHNLLTLNIDKTKFMTFYLSDLSKPPSNISVRAHSCLPTEKQCSCLNISRVDNIKYLGVIIDEHLNWHKQIDYVCARVRKLIFIFKKLRCSTNRNTMFIVYDALCSSILRYCIPAWGGIHKTYILKLERAQRAVLKVMLFKNFLYPTTQLYQESQVLTVRQLFILCSVLKKHSEMVYTVSNFNSSSRRRDSPFTILFTRTMFARKQYLILSSYIYNKIDYNLHIVSLNKFEIRKKLKVWLLNKDYNSTEDILQIGE